MTRVDFYLVTVPDGTDRFACRLIEKAWRLGHRVYVRTRDAAHTDSLDRLLWTFRDQAFVPHETCEAADTAAAAVLIGHTADTGDHAQVLVNLASEVPDSFSRFERVAEVFGNLDVPLRAARERYNFYQERGYPLQHHRV